MAMAQRKRMKKLPMLHLLLTKISLTAAHIHIGTDCPTGSNDANESKSSHGYEGGLNDAPHPHYSAYASLLQQCIDIKSLSDGKLIHAHMIHCGFTSQIFLQTKLIIMYAKCGSLSDARQLFDEMPKRNAVSWNAMTAAYARQEYNDEALALYYRMQREGIRPDKYTFAAVIPACANMAALKQGKEIHEDVIREGVQSDMFVGSALINLYAKCESIEDARQVFDEIPDRDVVLWNAMIAAYAQNGLVEQALKLFQKMPDRNVVSWTAMVGGYAQNMRLDEALRLFQKMPERNDVSWSAMIAGYAHNGCLDEALELFQKMPQRNEVSWTAIIGGYAQNGSMDEALKLFGRMQLAGLKPDSVTFTSILPACANLAALKNGREVHGNIIRRRFQSHVLVGNALVDMYAKCGSIKDAIQVFDGMPMRDVVSWNAMIVGYAKHGCAKEALQLFELMQHSGTRPDYVTFIGVLSACSHAGLVDDGWQYFDLMSQMHSITPVPEHYCCMVDLLGRAGHLDEAQDFISRMPIEPSVDVWGSLLGACRIHANVELGERVAECLFKLDPNKAGCYVLLSNIYAAAGRWNDVERVRKMMKGRRVKKTPGCSWIEVNNRVHSFLVNDRSHLQTHEIYRELERLSQQMKEAGYVPDTNFVLLDVEEE